MLHDEEVINTVDTMTVLRYRERPPAVNTCSYRSEAIPVDDEGDLCLPRMKPTENLLKIEHSEYTNSDLVGLQIWNGALLLADFIISENIRFRGKHVLELGSGTGLLGLIAAKYCDSVVCTDLNAEVILNTICKNFDNNRSSVRANYRILRFDFSKDWDPEIEQVIKETDIFLASELIYSDEISLSLINTFMKILASREHVSIYISIEKRYVFTLLNQKVEAKHYEYFFNTLKKALRNSSLHYDLHQVNDIPQHFYEYERNQDIELWCISYG